MDTMTSKEKGNDNNRSEENETKTEKIVKVYEKVMISEAEKGDCECVPGVCVVCLPACVSLSVYLWCTVYACLYTMCTHMYLCNCGVYLDVWCVCLCMCV